MKKIAILTMILFSYSVMAENKTAPWLEISKINHCDNSEVANVDADLQGTYITTYDDIVVIRETGIVSIESFPITGKDGKAKYATEADINEQGYCVAQAVHEGEDSLNLSIQIKKNEKSKFTFSRDSNRISVSLAKGKANKSTYKNTSYGFAMILYILPAGGYGTSGTLNLTKIAD
jgi:hypothetical protein